MKNYCGKYLVNCFEWQFKKSINLLSSIWKYLIVLLSKFLKALIMDQDPTARCCSDTEQPVSLLQICLCSERRDAHQLEGIRGVNVALFIRMVRS